MKVNGILNFRTTSKKDTICSFQKRKKVANTPFLHQIFFFNPTRYCSTCFQHKRKPHFSRILVNLRIMISSFYPLQFTAFTNAFTVENSLLLLTIILSFFENFTSNQGPWKRYLLNTIETKDFSSFPSST